MNITTPKHQQQRKLGKLSKRISTIITLIVVVGFVMLFIGLNSLYNESKDKISGIYQAEHYIAQINGGDAIIWIEEDGSYSARVQYERCEPLGWIDDCRWDREIIKVEFKK